MTKKITVEITESHIAREVTKEDRKHIDQLTSLLGAYCGKHNINANDFVAYLETAKNLYLDEIACCGEEHDWFNEEKPSYLVNANSTRFELEDSLDMMLQQEQLEAIAKS